MRLTNWCGQNAVLDVSTPSMLQLWDDDSTKNIDADATATWDNYKVKKVYDTVKNQICPGYDYYPKFAYLVYKTSSGGVPFLNTRGSSGFSGCYVVQRGEMKSISYRSFEDGSLIFPCYDPSFYLEIPEKPEEAEPAKQENEDEDKPADDELMDDMLSMLSSALRVMLIVFVIIILCAIVGAVIFVLYRVYNKDKKGG